MTETQPSSTHIAIAVATGHETTSTPMKVSTPQQQSPLLQLPPELRNRIYRYALISDVRLELERLSRPALTDTCRQVQAESLPIFFTDSSFSYITTKDTPTFEGKHVTLPSPATWLDSIARQSMVHIFNLRIEQMYRRPNGRLWQYGPLAVVQRQQHRLVLVEDAQTRCADHLSRKYPGFQTFIIEAERDVAAKAQAHLDAVAARGGEKSAVSGLSVDDVVKLAKILLCLPTETAVHSRYEVVVRSESSRPMVEKDFRK